MQTFLPYADYIKSAKVLDYKRLGKQRVETLQILRTLAGISGGWQNHPAVKMWRGHEQSLITYGIEMCYEWIARGYNDTCLDKIKEMRERFPADTTPPRWLGNAEVHRSHQSNLVRKFPEHYSVYFDVPDDLPYVWITE